MICIYMHTYIHVFMYPGSSYPLQEVGSTNSTIAGASVLISFQRFYSGTWRKCHMMPLCWTKAYV